MSIKRFHSIGLPLFIIVAVTVASALQSSFAEFARNNPINSIDPLGLDVINNSDKPVVMKPEEDKDPPAVVPPGIPFKGKQDGIYIMNNGVITVFKTVKNIDVTISKDGSVTTSGGNLIEKTGQVCIGGFKNDAFLAKWQNWPSKEKVKELIDKWNNENKDKKPALPKTPPSVLTPPALGK